MDFSKIRGSVTSLWTMGEVKDSEEEGHSCRRKPRGEEREGSFHGKDVQVSLGKKK